MSEDQKLTLAQAATRLGMNQERVRRRIENGELTGGQAFGRLWYVTEASVEAYLARDRSAHEAES